MSVRLTIDDPFLGVIKSQDRTLGALAETVDAPPEARIAVLNILCPDPGAEAYRLTRSVAHRKRSRCDPKRGAELLRSCPTEVSHKVGGVLLRRCRIGVGERFGLLAGLRESCERKQQEWHGAFHDGDSSRILGNPQPLRGKPVQQQVLVSSVSPNCP